MAAFVLSPEAPEHFPVLGTRLDIFPGSSTPAVFAARAPFWIGYGFVPTHGEVEPERREPLDERTRFGLILDGEPVTTHSVVHVEGSRVVRSLTVATFESGLAAGWHRFAGRWYVEDKLVVTSDMTIEFVEP
jgi:hypothetical protein